jgi:rare lipoprotein A
MIVAVAIAASLMACSRGGVDRPSASLSRPATPYRADVAAPTAGPASALGPAPAYAPKQAATAGGYKVGNPYRIGLTWYVPREDPGYDRTGIGSWYGADFHGRRTANGETYNMHALTAAHPTLPLPSYLFVTNEGNGRTILIRLNDRGPYVGGRIVDLSQAAARALGYDQAGTANVRVRYAGRAPLDGNDTRERQFLAAQPWNRGQIASNVPAPSPAVRPWQPAPAWSIEGYRGGRVTSPAGGASWGARPGLGAVP